MGNSSSHPSVDLPRLKQVFASELSTISHLVNNIITPDNLFISDEYNLLGKEACSRFTFVLESSLKKHLKVQVRELNNALLLIPKQDRLAVGSRVVDKSEMCNVIATHYTKCLYLLCLVKYVYDLEHGGDHSIAGIVQRNVRLVGNLLEVNYCALPQKAYNQLDKRIDFGKLQGLKFFVEHFLNPEEQGDLFEHFRLTFGKIDDERRVAQAICQSQILSQDDLKDIYNIRPNCKNARKKASNSNEWRVFVAEGNPILSSDLCMSKKKLIIQLQNNKQSKTIKAALDKLHSDYTVNLLETKKCLERLVYKTDPPPENPKGCRYALRNLSDSELDILTADLKRIITKLYLQPLVGYQRLLEIAKTMPSITLEE
jgi:hypothetical protein